jgi:hypothetical protein
MAGILYSLALYVAAAIWFWDRFNPPLALYSRQRFVVIGYILFGIGLGTLPLFSSTGGRSPVYNSAANVNSYTE